MITKNPYAWSEEKALDFPAIWDALSRHHPWNHPVSYFMIAVIFFEETGFCNIPQADTPQGYGVGFGQLEVRNPEKKEFYAWLGLPTEYQLVAQKMLSDKDLSVKVHCKYFQYLTTIKGLGLEGCLSAQVGKHVGYKQLFKEGAAKLEKAFNDNNRPAYIEALNHARRNSPKNNAISEKFFPEYWNYILPESWFTLGY
jgi:hypothetical protein